MHALLLFILLRCCFSPFWSPALPVAGVLRQLNFYEVKDVSPMSNPHTGGPGSLSFPGSLGKTCLA